MGRVGVGTSQGQVICKREKSDEAIFAMKDEGVQHGK